MRAILFLSMFLLSAGLSAQDITETICTQYEAGQYKAITGEYGEQIKSLPYKALFHVGLAYYKQGKDKSAIEIMEMCIDQDKKDSGPLYIKAKSLNFLRQFGKAATSFQKAIEIEGGNGSYYAGLGDAYMSMNHLEKALTAYQSAVLHEDCPERPYQKIPLILSAMGQSQSALEAYYAARDNVDRDSDGYLNVLFNIGLREAMNLDYFEAKKALSELVEMDPSYFRAYPILIQTNIGLRKLDEVPALKEKLYSAHAQGLLKYSMKDKFCFDQFTWDNKLIIKAYERFESEKNLTYFKHIYEVQENDIPAYSIQTKHIPKQAKPYILQKSMGDTAYTYAATFDRSYRYDELKTAVINIIAEKSQPIE